MPHLIADQIESTRTNRGQRSSLLIILCGEDRYARGRTVKISGKSFDGVFEEIACEASPLTAGSLRCLKALLLAAEVWAFIQAERDAGGRGRRDELSYDAACKMCANGIFGCGEVIYSLWKMRGPFFMKFQYHLPCRISNCKSTTTKAITLLS